MKKSSNNFSATTQNHQTIKNAVSSLKTSVDITSKIHLLFFNIKEPRKIRIKDTIYEFQDIIHLMNNIILYIDENIDKAFHTDYDFIADLKKNVFDFFDFQVTFLTDTSNHNWENFANALFDYTPTFSPIAENYFDIAIADIQDWYSYYYFKGKTLKDIAEMDFPHDPIEYMPWMTLCSLHESVQIAKKIFYSFRDAIIHQAKNVYSSNEFDHIKFG